MRRPAPWLACPVPLALAAACAFALAVGLASPATAQNVQRPELVPLAEVSLEKLEPPIQEQLIGHRAIVERLLADPSVSLEELGAAFGRMGQLYVLYDLSIAAEAALKNAITLLPEDFRWYHYIGMIYYTEGDLEDARDAFSKAAELEPKYIPSWVRLGRAQKELSETEAAEASFREALELFADLPAAHEGLGQVLQAQGEYAEAVEHYERALELQPDASTLYTPLAMCYRRLGDMEKAREYAARTEPTPVAVHLQDPILEGLVELIEGAQIHFSRGLEALKRDRIELAVEEFRTAVKIDPNDALSFYNLGLSLMRAKELWSAPPTEEEILAPLQRAVELDPGYRDAHYMLGTVLGKSGRVEESIDHYRRAHEIDPIDDEAHLMWALALNHQGDPALAIEELGKLLENHPEHARALLNLGSLQVQEGDLDGALESYRRITELPDSEEFTEGRVRLADLLLQRGQVEEAVPLFEAVLESEPDRIGAHRGLASALARQGRFLEAAGQFEAVVAQDPEDFESRFGLGLSLVLGGDYPEALARLEEAVRSFPESLPLKHLLARLLATCPEDEVRDGPRAVELAMEVFRQAQSVSYAETVAMALAEAGRWAEAVEWQSQVVQQTQRLGNPGAVESARRRLEMYGRGEPVRSPWNDEG